MDELESLMNTVRDQYSYTCDVQWPKEESSRARLDWVRFPYGVLRMDGRSGPASMIRLLRVSLTSQPTISSLILNRHHATPTSMLAQAYPFMLYLHRTRLLSLYPYEPSTSSDGSMNSLPPAPLSLVEEIITDTNVATSVLTSMGVQPSRQNVPAEAAQRTEDIVTSVYWGFDADISWDPSLADRQAHARWTAAEHLRAAGFTVAQT